MIGKLIRICKIAKKTIEVAYDYKLELLKTMAKDKDVSNLIANVCIGVGIIGLLLKIDNIGGIKK